MAIEFFDTSNTSEYDLGGLLANDNYKMHREKTSSNLESLLAMSVWMPWAKWVGGFSDDFLEGYKNSFEIIGTNWVRMLENLPTVDHPKDNKYPEKFVEETCSFDSSVFFPTFPTSLSHPDGTKKPKKWSGLL